MTNNKYYLHLKTMSWHSFISCLYMILHNLNKWLEFFIVLDATKVVFEYSWILECVRRYKITLDISERVIHNCWFQRLPLFAQLCKLWRMTICQPFISFKDLKNPEFFMKWNVWILAPKPNYKILYMTSKPYLKWGKWRKPLKSAVIRDPLWDIQSNFTLTHA